MIAAGPLALRERLEVVSEATRQVVRPSVFGVMNNSWSGLGRDSICHCENCRRSFRQRTGKDVPQRKDWDDPVYRAWIRWNYDRRLEIWDLNNRTTRQSGGADCLWLGMIHGDPFRSHLAFCDLKAIAERAKILMNDQQGRLNSGFGNSGHASAGFEQNAQSGKLLHGLLGWEKIIPESMAMYVRGEETFRKASAPPLEAQKWMVSGFAGGISPWWNHVGAEQEDRRQFMTAQKLMNWHSENEDVLYHRKPIASVGVVWNSRNAMRLPCSWRSDARFIPLRTERRSKIEKVYEGFTKIQK